MNYKKVEIAYYSFSCKKEKSKQKTLRTSRPLVSLLAVFQKAKVISLGTREE
jgi:hypothetical protein